jgi:hypothetical protein
MTFYTGDCLIEVTAWAGLTVDILAFIFSVFLDIRIYIIITYMYDYMYM